MEGRRARQPRRGASQEVERTLRPADYESAARCDRERFARRTRKAPHPYPAALGALLPVRHGPAAPPRIVFKSPARAPETQKGNRSGCLLPNASLGLARGISPRCARLGCRFASGFATLRASFGRDLRPSLASGCLLLIYMVGCAWASIALAHAEKTYISVQSGL